MKHCIDLTYLYDYALNFSDIIGLDSYIDLDLHNQLPDQFAFNAENLVLNCDKSFYKKMLRTSQKLRHYDYNNSDIDDSVILKRAQIMVTGLKGSEVKISLRNDTVGYHLSDCKITKGDFYLSFLGVNANYIDSWIHIFLIFTGNVFISFDDQDIIKYENGSNLLLTLQEIKDINTKKKDELIKKALQLNKILMGFSIVTEKGNKESIFFKRRQHYFVQKEYYSVAEKSEE